jgi:hypothetical protein
MNPIQKPPQEIAEDRVTLAEEYSRLSDEYGTLEQDQIKHFVANRDKYKSDKACERVWQATESGLRWVYLKSRLKGIEKLLSASNTLLRHYENQGKNLY